jgi:arylsulfatase A-like enzyme
VQTQAQTPSTRKPNIVVIISDQFRADASGCMEMNPMNRTPNLDAMARRRVLFRQAIANQPVCAPARTCMFTGQYPAQQGVWKNALGLKPDAVTLPGVLRDQGYTSNYIGKWHLSAQTPTDKMSGPVPPVNRGRFLDFREASNALELTSHPFEGDMYDGDGKPLHFAGEYRADFLTDRAVRFLKEKRRKDRQFLLVVSYLEVHHQHDSDLFAPAKKYATQLNNPWVPQDLRPLPGT